MGRLRVLEDVLALDALCLREPDGEAIDLAIHRERLEASARKSRFAMVRRRAELVAYSYMWPLGEGRWFVGGFCIHPDHRNARVIAELFSSFADIVESSGAVELHSHALAANTESLRLHRRLGFVEVQRDDRSIAFVARVDHLRALLPVRSRNCISA